MLQRTVVAIGSFIITASILQGLVMSPTRAEDLEIGAIYPLTGPMAYIGEAAREGAASAVELTNQEGGVNGKSLKLTVEDSQGEGKIGISTFRRLIERQRMPVVLVQLTSVSMALRPIAEEAKVLLLSGSAHPGLVSGYKYIIRDFFTVDAANRALMQFLARRDAKRIAILHTEDEWGEAAAEDLTAQSRGRSLTIVGRESFEKKATDVRPQLLRLRTATPDLLYLLGTGPMMATAYSQLSQAGLKIPVVGWTLCSQPDVLKAAAPFLEGSFSVDPSLDQNSAGYQHLLKHVQNSRIGNYIFAQTVFAFDAVRMIVEALRQGRTTSEQIREYIVSRKFKGASGEIEFTPEGDCKQPMRISMIKAGECRAVD